LCEGNNLDDPDRAVSEYLAEGACDPMLMIRQGIYKYTCCSADPEQLFNLADDPDELNNLASASAHKIRLQDFRRQAVTHWDVTQVKKDVIASQQRRRAVHAALRIGRYRSWDFQPQRQASEEYTCSHLDLTDFDITSRYPHPPVFKPSWR